jgi:hypothetical protein
MRTKTLTTKNVKENGFIECSVCLFDTSMAMMGKDGICEYCKLQEELRNQAREPWVHVVDRIKRKGRGKRYDCLIGISGGEDSSVLLYLAVKEWGLRPLVIHFNNRTNRPEADSNIKILTEKLSVNFIEYFLDKNEYDNLTDSLLKAGVPDCDIANDVCMSKMMFTAAKENGIKYILNGHSFREEGSSPKAWSVIDYTYLNSIFKRYNGHDLVNYPLLTVWDQIVGAILGIKQVRPYHYADHGRARVLSVLKSWGWQDYGGKHNENIYTAFIGNYVLPKKFGIDKRRTYLSAHIREGKMTKEYAREILQKQSEFNLDDLGDRKNHALHLVNSSPIQPRSNFKMTNFKRLKPVFWLLMKFKVLPVTAYRKYCK